MLGRDMEKVFSGEDFIGLDRDELDITNRNAVFETFMAIKPDVVINCAAYTAVDDAETNAEVAEEINGHAVAFLAKGCREIDATLVHFSTDYVFDGEKRGGYDEEDALNPINAYGRSKALGENLIMDEMDSLSDLAPKEGKYFLIRTSWLFGKHGKNFVKAMLSNCSCSKDELKVVNDQFGKPTYTLDLAQQVKWLVQSNEYPTGIYHITNEDTTTWYEYAKEIFRLAEREINVLACDSSEFPRPAKRPKYSTLNNNKLPKLRSWKEALKDYLKD